jgi:hypothetical protein
MAVVDATGATRMRRRSAAMKKWSAVLALSLLAFSSFSTTGGLAADAPRIEKDELKTMLGNPEVVVIDVRSYSDWLLSGDKIKGAVREDYRGFAGWEAKFPRDKTLVLYCA